jgi:hypothetical protein
VPIMPHFARKRYFRISTSSTSRSQESPSHLGRPSPFWTAMAVGHLPPHRTLARIQKPEFASTVVPYRAVITWYQTASASRAPVDI